MNQAVNKKCEGCGAEITSEQIVQKQAGLVKGVLLCPKCVDQKRREALEAQKAATAATAHKQATEEERISLVDAAVGGGSGLIRSFAQSMGSLQGSHSDTQFKRPIAPPDMPPTRCRTFNGKLTPAALAHMDSQISDWMDSHPEFYIKHVACTVGPFEAKHVEQHLIVTIFY